MSQIRIPIAVQPVMVEGPDGILVQHYHKDKQGNKIKTTKVVTTLLDTEVVVKLQNRSFLAEQRWGKGQQFINRYLNMLWKIRYGQNS